MYMEFSKALNQLINTYFLIEKEEDMEVQIAGSEEERNSMMPLLYVESHREKAELESEIKKILKNFHHGQGSTQILDPNNRMKALDVTKILMGIRSTRESVKRFEQDGTVWARRQDYDYNDILKLGDTIVGSYYQEILPIAANALAVGKKVRQ